MYLNKFQYQNASTNDLWEVLEEASEKPISSMMPLWTKRLGYPVISVEREQQGNDCKLVMKQFKYCAIGDQEGSCVVLSFVKEYSPEVKSQSHNPFTFFLSRWK